MLINCMNPSDDESGITSTNQAVGNSAGTYLNYILYSIISQITFLYSKQKCSLLPICCHSLTINRQNK